MIVMAATAALTSFFSFLLGYLVYRKAQGREPGRIFLLMSMLLGIWAFIALFAYSSTDLRRFILLFRIGFVFQMLYIGGFLHFALTVTGYAPKRPGMVYLVYVPCVAAIVLSIAGTGNSENYLFDGHMWCFRQRYLSLALLCPMTVWFSYYGISAWLYFKRSRAAESLEKTRLYLILFFFIVLILTGTFLEGIIFPLIFDTPSVGPDLLFKFAWLLCIGLLVDRYHFMTAPENLEDIALTEFPEYALLVLDELCTIRKANLEASLLFCIDTQSLEGAHIEAIIPSGKRLLQEMEKLKENDASSFAGVVEIWENGSSQVLIDLKISLLHNKSRTVTGFIILGKPIRKKRHLKTIFNLSQREVEIIEELLRGKTNGKIAQLLGISERTVKSHLTHIFTKLGVANRMQLYALLKENHYISEHLAEKNLLILQNPQN